MNQTDKLMYKIEDNSDKDKAIKFSEEWNYNSLKGKIPIGIIYQSEKQNLEEKWPQLKEKLKK